MARDVAASWMLGLRQEAKMTWGSGVWVAQEGDDIIDRNGECRRKAWVRNGRVEVKARRVP